MINPELRRRGFTGSDQGALFGVDPDRDLHTVIAEKKYGLVLPVTQRMRLGGWIEPGIINAYAGITGKRVKYVNETFQHPTIPWMIYTPDAWCEDEKRVVDAKLVAWDQWAKKWGPKSNDIPEQIQLQMWHYMAALDFPLADVAAWCGDELRIYTIERDREVERVMRARNEECYRKYIEGDEMPPIGSSVHAARWLQQAFPNHKRPDMRAATEEEIADMRRYARVRKELSELEREKTGILNRLREAVGMREGIQSFGAKFTWRKTKDTKVVNYKNMAIALLHNFIKDEKAREKMWADYTSTKEGYRKIYFKCDDFADRLDDDAEDTTDAAA